MRVQRELLVVVRLEKVPPSAEWTLLMQSFLEVLREGRTAGSSRL